MLARIKMTALMVVVGTSVASAGPRTREIVTGIFAEPGGSRPFAKPLTGDDLTVKEKTLLAWARGFQDRGKEVRQRISSPSYSEVSTQMAETIEQVAAERRQHLETGMNSLGRISAYGQGSRTIITAWSLGMEHEVSRRQGRLLYAWDEFQKEYSPSGIIADALKRQRMMNRTIMARRTEVLREETKLVRLERASQKAVIKTTAKQYATNWLLGGHPEAYLPTKWDQLCRKSGGRVVIRTKSKTFQLSADEELKDLRASIMHLTEVLVAIGLGENSPERIVVAERQLLQTRRQAQTMLVARTGRQLAGNATRLATR